MPPRRQRRPCWVLGPDQEGWVAADGAARVIRGDEAREHYRMLTTIVRRPLIFEGLAAPY